jgi:hypothetical protein
MVFRVLRFVRLPFLLLLIFALGRFWLGLRGVPYAPRGNAIFSVVVLTIVSSLYFGALSRRVGGFGWGGTVLVGLSIGLWAQILVFSLTLISYFGHFDSSYYLNPDALFGREGVEITTSTILQTRVGGLVVNSIIAIVAACLGRLLSGLAPAPAPERAEQSSP